MRYDPTIHDRRSIRLKGYDYSRAGAYFVTVCAQGRQCLFGDVINGKMQLNDAGRMVMQWWHEIENKYPDIICDEFICMPNHAHFIVINVGADLCVCPDELREHAKVGKPVEADLCVCPGNKGEHTGSPQHAGSPQHTGSPLHRVVQWFKTMTTNGYIRGVKQNGWLPFSGKLWQRNYYEHIIRNDDEMNRIWEYIKTNPARWAEDRENPYGKIEKE